MPRDASSHRLFTISGNLRRAGRRVFLPIGNTANAGTGTRWYFSSFLERSLPRASISPRGLQPVYGTRSSSSRPTTFCAYSVSPWNSSSRLKTISGFQSSTASRIGVSSDCTPIMRTSCPLPFNVLMTSYSVFQTYASFSVISAMLSGGIRSGCARHRIRSEFIQRTIACARRAAGAPPWCSTGEPSICAAHTRGPAHAASAPAPC